MHGGDVPSIGFATRTPGSDAFVAREEARVEMHQRSLCPLLESFAGRSPHILDVGCSTGGSTVAMALSEVLAPDRVVGIDPEPLSIRAALVRALAHGVAPDRLSFLETSAGSPLPFNDGQFDLVVCISVLEFIPSKGGRAYLVGEMKRVARPGGHIFIATPSPLRLRDVHAKRVLGDILRRPGYPWATPPWALREMLADCALAPIDGWLAVRALSNRRWPVRRVPRSFARALAWTAPWQRILARKPFMADPARVLRKDLFTSSPQ
jgi:SAM-dependent methyltransferase